MQTTGTEGNRANVNVTTEAYTSGHLRRQQLYDRLLSDGVYDRIQGDRRDALARDRFD